MIPILIQISIFILVIGYIIWKYGILDSISQFYYELPKKHNIFFPLFLCSLAIPMFFLETAWSFYTGAFLIVVAIAPEYKEELTDDVHGFGAVGLIAMASIGLLVEGIWFPMVCGLILTLAIRRIGAIDNKTWWIEIIWFLYIEVGLIFRWQSLVC